MKESRCLLCGAKCDCTEEVCRGCKITLAKDGIDSNHINVNVSDLKAEVYDLRKKISKLRLQLVLLTGGIIVWIVGMFVAYFLL